MNFGKQMIEPVHFRQTPMKATNITIEYIASLFGLRLHPGPLPDAHSHPAAQANQGSREPSLCRMYMQMQTMAKTKTVAHGEAPQSDCRCPDPHGTVTGGDMPHTIYMQ